MLITVVVCAGAWVLASLVAGFALAALIGRADARRRGVATARVAAELACASPFSTAA